MNNIKQIFAKCDKCSHEWYIKQFENVRIEGSIDKTFFTCPACHHEYLCYYADLVVRDLQAKLRKVQNKVFSAAGKRLRTLKQEEVELNNAIKERMQSLKVQMEGSD
ncbi:hypothetical protein [Lysinibacillus sp. FSL W8-0992]|uniref:hypothetical protein n=1 Tax=Lysinibacillus sp. FSL W8-0992 TaxID=2954643 RepID=UPI0030F69FF1